MELRSIIRFCRDISVASLLMFLVGVGVTACGKSPKSSVVSAAKDLGCGGLSLTLDKADALKPVGAARRLLVTTSDYMSGQLASIDLLSGVLGQAALAIHSDAIVRAFAGEDNVFVVNRLGGDNVQIVSRDLTNTLAQYSLGAAGNAQDLVVVNPGAAFATRMRATALLKINPSTGQTLKPIDLSAAADADGYPEMTYATQIGGKLWVQLQRLDTARGYIPAGNSCLAQIDLASDRLDGFASLRCANPITDFKTGPDGALYVGGAGKVGRRSAVLDGCVERLGARSAIIVTEEALGGDLIDFELLSESVGVALIGIPPGSQWVTFDPRSGRKTGVVLTSTEYAFQQFRFDPVKGRLYLADRSQRTPRIRSFDVKRLREIPEERWDLRLPPYFMALER